MEVGFKTDRGLYRANNEDNILVDPELGLFIVADGMGGHKAGKLASSIAVVEISRHIRNRIGWSGEASVVIQEAITRANAEILGRSSPLVEEADMGSTVVLALMKENSVHIAHVGDSRAYMISNGDMRQLTNNHTFVADAVREGWITIGEARSHEARHGLYAALGVEDETEIEISEWPWNDDSRLLLCSDGLTEMLIDEEIEGIINGSSNPQEACDLLIEAANAAGGKYNISVIIVSRGESSH
jgi:PPM family protein phosphatase